MQHKPFIGKPAFGNRREPHVVTISRGGNIHAFAVRPWIAVSLTLFGLTFAITYLIATGYLILRDDLISATVARRAQLQYAYEDRIADLRARIDRITSRQLLKTESFDAKMDNILKRQDEIAGRQAAVANVIEKARAQGLHVAVGKPRPKPAPGSIPAIDGLNAARQGGAKGERHSLLNSTDQPRADLRILGLMRQKLDQTNLHQAAALDAITISAENGIAKIGGTARRLGVPITLSKHDLAKAVGGPYEPLDAHQGFERRVIRAEKAMRRLTAFKRRMRRHPILKPLAGRMRIASRFGPRLDPFLRRPAMHGGVDFKAPYGTAVRATGPGTVVGAGRKGGYGNVVELKHASGLRTRYAHLSRITVRLGQKIKAGRIVGRVGSTGRSTGPHLHYETRLGKKSLNPLAFINAGNALRGLLN